MKTNFPIQNLTLVEVKNKISKGVKENKQLRDLFARNQASFVVDFFGDLLVREGKFIKNTHLKDLMIAYYIDYYLKEKITNQVLKIERYLNIIINNLYNDQKISNKTGDKQNTFGEVVNFVKKKMSEEDTKKIIESYNTIHQTDFNFDNFVCRLLDVVDLRNFTLHHYPIISFQYASIINQGNNHQKKDGPKRTLPIAMESLSKFISTSTAKRFCQKINNIVDKFKFTDHEIKNFYFEKISKLLNIEIFLKINRPNPHYSIINLINKEK